MQLMGFLGYNQFLHAKFHSTLKGTYMIQPKLNLCLFTANSKIAMKQKLRTI